MGRTKVEFQRLVVLKVQVLKCCQVLQVLKCWSVEVLKVLKVLKRWSVEVLSSVESVEVLKRCRCYYRALKVDWIKVCAVHSRWVQGWDEMAFNVPTMDNYQLSPAS